MQDLALGPVAALEAIKHLGTNGGGFFGANSATPFENPTVISNIIETISMMIPVSYTHLLVENLLSVTRLEDGTMNLNLQIELVDEVIEGALKHISRDHSDYELKFIHSEELLLAKMDSRLIIQVIINIVDNALKYTPKGSKIEIYARKENQMIAISIADNGKGIADCAKEKIFDMFYTADSKVADSRRGLGLGLFLCKSIIQAVSYTHLDVYKRQLLFLELMEILLPNVPILSCF